MMRRGSVNGRRSWWSFSSPTAAGRRRGRSAPLLVYLIRAWPFGCWRRAGLLSARPARHGKSTTKWSRLPPWPWIQAAPWLCLPPSGGARRCNMLRGRQSARWGRPLPKSCAISPARLWLRCVLWKKWGYSPCPGGRSTAVRSCLRMRKPLRWSLAESRPKPMRDCWL